MLFHNIDSMLTKKVDVNFHFSTFSQLLFNCWQKRWINVISTDCAHWVHTYQPYISLYYDYYLISQLTNFCIQEGVLFLKDFTSSMWSSILSCRRIYVIPGPGIPTSRDRKLGRSVQEWGKQHRIITTNAVIIKFHSQSWAAFGCQMTSRWSSAEQRTTQRWFGSQMLPKISCWI